MTQTMAQRPFASLAGGAVHQFLAVAGAHGEPDACVRGDSTAARASGFAHHVIGHVQQVLDLLRQAGRVAVAEGGDVQRPLLGAEGGDELPGEVNLPGVGGLVARRAFQQLQQRQAGERVGRVGRRRRTGQLLGRELSEQGAEPLVGGFLALAVPAGNAPLGWKRAAAYPSRPGLSSPSASTYRSESRCSSTSRTDQRCARKASSASSPSRDCSRI